MQRGGHSMWRRGFALIAALWVISGCGDAVATSNPIAPSSPIIATNTPGPTAIDLSAVRERLIRKNIDDRYCGEPPKPTWCSFLELTRGRPDVTLDATNLVVVAKASTPRNVAQNMCRDIAFEPYDENDVPLGYSHVFVETAAGEAIADCSV